MRRVAAAEPLDRLLHADLLAATGRHRGGAAWYATLGGGSPQELPLVGFAALGMARTSERMGDRAARRADITGVSRSLWRDADPALQAVVTAATQKIAALEAAPR